MPFMLIKSSSLDPFPLCHALVDAEKAEIFQTIQTIGMGHCKRQLDDFLMEISNAGLDGNRTENLSRYYGINVK